MCWVYQTMDNDEYKGTHELTQHEVNIYHETEQYSARNENLHSEYTILPQSLIIHDINIVPNNPCTLYKMKEPSIRRYDERYLEIENWLISYNNMQQEIKSRINNKIYSTMLSSENEMKENNSSSQSSLQGEADSLNSEQDLVNDIYSKNIMNTCLNVNKTMNNIKNESDDFVLIKNAGNIFYSMLLNQNVTSKVRDKIISEIVLNLISNYDLSILYKIFEAMQKQFRIQLGIPPELDDQHDKPLTNNLVTRNIKAADKCSQTDLRMVPRHFRPNALKRNNNYAYKITKSNYLRREQLCHKIGKNNGSRSAPKKFKENKQPYISASEYSEDSEAEQNLSSLEERHYQALNGGKEMKNKQIKTHDRNAALKKQFVNKYGISETTRINKKLCLETIPSWSNETLETSPSLQMNTRMLSDGLNEVSDSHSFIISGERVSSLDVIVQNKETLKSAGRMPCESTLNKNNEDKKFILNNKLSKTAININIPLNRRKNKRALSSSFRKTNMLISNNAQQNKTNLTVCKKKKINEDINTASENKSKENLMFSSMCTEKTKSSMICALVDELSQIHKKEINEHGRHEKKIDSDTCRVSADDLLWCQDNTRNEEIHTSSPETNKWHNGPKSSIVSNKIMHSVPIQATEENMSPSKILPLSVDINFVDKTVTSDTIGSCIHTTVAQCSSDKMSVNQAIDSNKTELTSFSSLNNVDKVKNIDDTPCSSNSANFLSERTGGKDHSHSLSNGDTLASPNYGRQSIEDTSKPILHADSYFNVNANLQPAYIKSVNKVSVDKELKLNFKERAQLALLKRLLNGKVKTKKILKERAETELQERKNLLKKKGFRKDDVTNNSKNCELTEVKLGEKNNCINKDSTYAEMITDYFTQKEDTRSKPSKTGLLLKKYNNMIADNANQEGNTRYNAHKIHVIHKTDMQLNEYAEMFINNDKKKGNTDSTPIQTVIVRSVTSLDINGTQELGKHTNIISINSVKETSKDNNINILGETVKETLTIKSSKRFIDGSVAHQGAYKRLLSALFVALLLLIYYLWTQQNILCSGNDIYEYLNIYWN